MNQLDVYYRALLDYRKQTLEDRGCSALRTAIAGGDTEKDKIVITRTNCIIEQDWVDAIETGLVHVEKALKEERQFIHSNGEVVPIEKVKHVSRESVEHLAKHSNLITKCEDAENLIPEKLYTVERLNDYTVYENRFLYMLLCYLRDFITIRYNNIQELSNRYEAEFSVNKSISSGKQKLSYSVSMHDVKTDDPYLKETNPSKDIIDKIHLLLKTVIAFLDTPLMQEVSKVAMLKPPITKTNVLKMNNNFKGAVALYEFIMSYNKKGYEVNVETHMLAPFSDVLADELAEAGGLMSFLVYEYGLDINERLKKDYLREEERRRVERIKERAERIESLKRRLKNSEISIEEYTVILEDQLRDLEGVDARAEMLAAELDTEREKNRQLTKANEELSQTVVKLHEDIVELKHKHLEEIVRLKNEHDNELNSLILKHETEMRECAEKHENEMRECAEKHENEVRELCEKHAEELQELRDRAAEAEKKLLDEMEEVKRHASEQIAEIETARDSAINEVQAERDTAVKEAMERFSDCSVKLQRSRKEYTALLEESRLDKARIKALGGVTENYTDRDRFNELEREYMAFTRIYKQQWELTKKEIKKKHLNIKNLRSQIDSPKKNEEITADKENVNIGDNNAGDDSVNSNDSGSN